MAARSIKAHDNASNINLTIEMQKKCKLQRTGAQKSGSHFNFKKPSQRIQKEAQLQGHQNRASSNFRNS